MPFDFVEGPTSTHMTLEQIADAVEEAGQEKRFVRLVNRLNISNRIHQYSAFTPGHDDASSPSAAARQADWRVGWRRKYSVLTQAGRRDLGWNVIFEAFDDGPARNILITVHGDSDRKEVERFLKHVFDKLWWDRSGAFTRN